MLSSNPGMVTNCFTAQNSASAAQLQRPVLHLEVSTPQRLELHLDLSTLQRPVLLLEVSTLQWLVLVPDSIREIGSSIPRCIYFEILTHAECALKNIYTC
jgi:hypothetical protein